LWKALSSLPEKERIAVTLRDIEGLSTSEVAEILESSESTVRSQISRARVRLKDAMDSMMGGQQ
jgi:RNA polymerase sigma-70 factor (ECF subfamily)